MERTQVILANDFSVERNEFPVSGRQGERGWRSDYGLPNSLRMSMKVVCHRASRFL